VICLGELEQYFIKEVSKIELGELLKVMDANDNGLLDYFGNLNIFLNIEFLAVAVEFDEYSKIENLKNLFNFLSGNK
jgi:hypothetical protein